MKVAGYNDSVFINCPFDAEYVPILRAIVYSVYRCGFFPKTALDEDDGLDNRLSKIVRQIKDSKYGIHDLSRIELSPANYPRFNMPFELGIFFGARMLGNGIQKRKNALILEKDKYSYQKFISDLAGMDIHAHASDAARAVQETRNWLANVSRRTLPSAERVGRLHQSFLVDLPVMAAELEFDPDHIPYVDYESMIVGWLLKAGPPA